MLILFLRAHPFGSQDGRGELILQIVLDEHPAHSIVVHLLLLIIKFACRVLDEPKSTDCSCIQIMVHPIFEALLVAEEIGDRANFCESQFYNQFLHHFSTFLFFMKERYCLVHNVRHHIPVLILGIWYFFSTHPRSGIKLLLFNLL